MMTAKTDGNNITLENGRVVEFVYPILEISECGDTLVIVLDVPPDKVMTENVFGMSNTGDLLWQIEPVSDPQPDSADVYLGINLALSTEDKIDINRWGGIASIVDVKTGRILGSRITK